MVLRRVVPLCLILGASLTAAPQQPVFRAQINLVEVDVVATDAQNRPVTDLRQDEFQVFEDGKPRDVVSFSQVNLPIQPPHSPDARDVATNAQSQDGRLFFLILDDVHTLRDRTRDVKAAARRLIERLGPHDQVAVLWMSLQKQGAREFSTSHAAVLQAIETFEATSTSIGRRNPEELGLPEFADIDDRPDRATGELASLDVQRMFERARPVIMIREVCNYLAAIGHRRKALVYVGQGPTGKLFKPNAQSGIDGELDVIRAMTAARRANVAMYSIGAGGVMPTDDAGFPTAEDPPGIPDTLGAFSRATGGFATIGAQGTQAVDRIIADTGSYYLLGYYADPPASSAKNFLAALAGNPRHGFREPGRSRRWCRSPRVYAARSSHLTRCGPTSAPTACPAPARARSPSSRPSRAVSTMPWCGPLRDHPRRPSARAMKWSTASSCPWIGCSPGRTECA